MRFERHRSSTRISIGPQLLFQFVPLSIRGARAESCWWFGHPRDSEDSLEQWLRVEEADLEDVPEEADEPRHLDARLDRGN